MGRTSTKRKDDDEAAGVGSNTDELLKDYVQQVARLEIKAEGIRGEIKDVLNQAKKDKFLKMAIRKAVKELRMTEEQLQAKKEVDEETQRITELCRGLPLFAHPSAEGAVASMHN